MGFRDRSDAGRQLAAKLLDLEGQDVVVLGLPRGGVCVAFEVARALHAPLDVIVVRKLGLPYQPELAMGAIGEDGVRVINHEVIRSGRVDPDELDAVERWERVQLERRVEQFRGNRLRVPISGRTAIVVDDGIATGSTARAACQVVRAEGAARVVLAAPVAPWASIAELASVADEVVCLETPEPFFAVGQAYEDFSQTSDGEVVDLLRRADEELDLQEAVGDVIRVPYVRDEDVVVRAGPVHLEGHLTVPEAPRGMVVFAHGSGSSRHSPRNRFVAAALNNAGFGTLLVDLLTAEEEHDRVLVFDVELLSDRLRDVTRWLRDQPEARETRIGYFGASTGAGAALMAAAHPDADIAAVVSRGGRPDLAGATLGDVHAPTLLIVGGLDDAVIQLNRQAQAHLHCENRLAVVPFATHLFEEPGALEDVADLARAWFMGHLAPPASLDGGNPDDRGGTGGP